MLPLYVNKEVGTVRKAKYDVYNRSCRCFDLFSILNEIEYTRKMDIMENGRAPERFQLL